MEQLLKKFRLKYITIDSNTIPDKQVKQEINDKLLLKKLKKCYRKKSIPLEILLEHGHSLANRFKIIYEEGKSTPTNWGNTMNLSYQKPDIKNLYDFWLDINQKIKLIPSIHQQSKEYSKLTNCLNPGQLLQCDYYRILQTFQEYGFQVLMFKENLGKYCTELSSGNSYRVFKFIIKNKHWLISMYYTNNVICVIGNLKPDLILNVKENREYVGDNFFSYNFIDKDTPNVCTDCFQ